MLSIYKYPLRIDDEISLVMPVGAELLTTQIQSDIPCLWAKVDTRAPMVRRIFRWRGTGHPADGLGEYVGTVQMHGGGLVFHLFVDPEV